MTLLTLAMPSPSIPQAINLFGYSDLPDNFICSFFGGFLYAFPTLTSLFYSFCIALNTQLVFVFGKRPGSSTLKFYIGIPIFLSLCICTLFPLDTQTIPTDDLQVSLLWVRDFTATMPALTCAGTRQKEKLPMKSSYLTFSLSHSGVSSPCST
jgi:hypothetical protein